MSQIDRKLSADQLMLHVQFSLSRIQLSNEGPCFSLLSRSKNKNRNISSNNEILMDSLATNLFRSNGSVLNESCRFSFNVNNELRSLLIKQIIRLLSIIRNNYQEILS